MADPDALPEPLNDWIMQATTKPEVQAAVRSVLAHAVEADMDVTAREIVETHPDALDGLTDFLQDRAVQVSEDLISRYRSR